MIKCYCIVIIVIFIFYVVYFSTTYSKYATSFALSPLTLDCIHAYMHPHKYRDKLRGDRH